MKTTLQVSVYRPLFLRGLNKYVYSGLLLLSSMLFEINYESDPKLSHVFYKIRIYEHHLRESCEQL